MKTLTQVVRRIKDYIIAQDDSVRTIIAPVEDAQRSENEYAQGDKLIWNNRLYDVLADIYVDDEFITYESGDEDPNIKLSKSISQAISGQVNIESASFTVTADGSTTYQDLFNELYEEHIYPHLSDDETIKCITNIHLTISGSDGCYLDSVDNVIENGEIHPSIDFSNIHLTTTKARIYQVSIEAFDSSYLYTENLTTISNRSNNIPNNGTKITASFNEIHIYG